MWIVRLVLLAVLAVLVGVCGYLLKHRNRYGRLLQNGAVNLVLVLLYNALCYLIVALPSRQSVVPPPAFLAHASVRNGFSVVGQALIGLAALVMVTALVQRKALGGQDSQGLLTSGIYRYARHPIYTGIVCMSLGLALASVNWEGLLMVPAVFAVNVVEAIVEERYDVGLRFPSQYRAYVKRTRRFGPLWCWLVVGGILAILAGMPYLA